MSNQLILQGLDNNLRSLFHKLLSDDDINLCDELTKIKEKFTKNFVQDIDNKFYQGSSLDVYYITKKKKIGFVYDDNYIFSFTANNKFNSKKISDILIISNSRFNDDVKLNDLNYKFLFIINSTFEKKLEIKNAKVSYLLFYNSNVKKIFDAFESEFEQAYFYKSIFKDFTAFENVTFGRSSKDDKFKTEFKYVTFESFSNFRSAKFLSGLDLSRANFIKDQPPNFLDATVVQENSTRETFRIIKNSFDEVGNKIEAGRFFIQEMRAYKQEMERKIIRLETDEFYSNFCLKYDKAKIKEKKYAIKKELVIFYINDTISKFGSNYIRPILLLIFAIIIYADMLAFNNFAPKVFNKIIDWILIIIISMSMLYSFKTKFKYYTLLFLFLFTIICLWIYNLFNECLFFDLSIINTLNDMAKGFVPYSKFLQTEMEFFSLIFYIIFLVLIWQIAVAIKRKVQR